MFAIRCHHYATIMMMAMQQLDVSPERFLPHIRPAPAIAIGLPGQPRARGDAEVTISKITPFLNVVILETSPASVSCLGRWNQSRSMILETRLQRTSPGKLKLMAFIRAECVRLIRRAIILVLFLVGSHNPRFHSGWRAATYPCG